MSTKDGGPAFPIPHPEMTVEGQGSYETQGMKLRDWFAGQALAGWSESHHGLAWRTNDGPSYGAEGMAATAYEIADAMIARRGKG